MEQREAEKQLSVKRSELNDLDRKHSASKVKEGNLQRAATAAQKSELEQAQKESKKLESDKSEAQKAVSKLESETSQSQKESEQLEATLSQKDKEVMRSMEDLHKKLEAEVSANAKASATAAGAITRLQDKDVAGTVAEIQRKYIENINTDALVVACLVALDRDSKRATTTLQAECPNFLKEIMKQQGERVDALTKASNKRAEAALGQDLDAATDTIKKATARLEDLKGKMGVK